MGWGQAMVNMSAVWDRTIEFVSDNLAVLLPVVAGVIFVPLAINEAITPLAGPEAPVMRAVLAAVSLVLVLVALVGRLAVTALALEVAQGAGEALRLALRRLLPSILVSLVLLVVFAILMLPVPGVMAAYGYDFAAAMQGETPEMAPVAAAVILLYILMLLPLIAWMGARLSLVSAAIVGEGLGLSAIGRSVALTRGIAMKIIGVGILYVVLVLAVALAVKTGFGSLFHLVLGGDEGISIASVLTALFSALPAAIFAMLASAFVAKLYRAAIARQGMDRGE